MLQHLLCRFHDPRYGHFYTPHDAVRMAATQKKNPTLSEIEDLLTAYKSTQLASDILKANTTSATTSAFVTADVNQVDHRSHHVSSKSNDHFLKRKSCPGYAVHHERSQCRHIDSVCNNWKRRGHISSVCLSAQKSDASSRAMSRHRSRNRGRDAADTSGQSERRTASNYRQHRSYETAHTINLLKEDVGIRRTTHLYGGRPKGKGGRYSCRFS